MRITKYKASVKLNDLQMKVKQITKILLTFAIILSSHNVLAQNGEGDYLSHYTNLGEPTNLYVISKSNMSLDEYQMITSLQGLLAQTEAQIYVTERTSYDYWLESMKTNYSISTEVKTDAIAILEEFKDQVSGYLLTKGGGVPGGWGTEETNAATSLAGIKNGIVISENLESEVQNLGLEMILDVRNMTNEEVFNEYKDQFNNNLLITQNHNIMQLRDYAIATKAFVYHEMENESAGFIDEVYSWVAPDSPQFGWGWAFQVNEKDERDYVGDAGAYGVYTNPSDWVLNLSTLAAVKKDSLKQNRVEATTENIETPEEAHYLAINMSDGDNYSFVLHGYADEGKYFDNKNSGNFPMNWTMPGSIIDLAPAALEYYYQNAKDTDYFVIGGTGSGYMFPSEYPDDDLDSHLEIVNEYMGRSDFSYIGMLDPADFGSTAFREVAEKYTAQPNVDGVYYVNYYQYEKGNGQIEIINGKPVIAMRENMWGLNDDQIVDLANKINNHSKNPKDPGAYSIMNLHAWTHDLNDAQLLVDNLDPHVKVVNMDELFQQVKKNVDLDFVPNDVEYGNNILPNHNFADDFNNWRLVKDHTEANIDEVNEIFLGGDDGRTLTYIGYNLLQVFSDRIEAEPGSYYKLRVKAQVTGDHGNQANFKIRFYDTNGNYLEEVQGFMPENTDGFVDKEVVMKAPQNAAFLDVEMAVWDNDTDLEIQVDEASVMAGQLTTSTQEIHDEIPEQFILKQNYPNPFNPTTQIQYSISRPSNVTLDVYNIQGQLIATLVDENKSAGVYEVSFDANSLSSGVYFYRMQAGNYVEVKKMTLIK